MPRSQISLSIRPTHPDADDRLGALALANSLDDVLHIIPISYRDGVKPILKELYNSSRKRLSSENALANLERHKAGGTLPPALMGMKVPALPVCQAYMQSSDSYESMRTNMEMIIHDQQIECLSLMLATKKDEVTWLQKTLLDPPVWKNDLRKASLKIYEDMKRAHSETAAVGQQFVHTHPEWIKTEYTKWYKDLTTFAERVIALARTHGMAKQGVALAKTKLKESVDVQMGNTGPSSSKSVEQIVAEQVKKAVESALKAKDPPSKDHKSEWHNNHHSINTDKVNRKRKQQEETVEHCFNTKKQCCEKTETRQQEREREKESLEICLQASFNPGKPYTYPDEILDLPFTDALKVLTLKTDVELLDEHRSFAPGIHIGKGISVPSKYGYHIGINLKFLYHQSLDLSLPTEAYSIFTNSVRWKYYWACKDHKDNSWNPRLKERFREPDLEAPLANFYIEAGLKAGLSELRNQLNKLVPPIKPPGVFSWTQTQELQNWLSENKYLLKPTDKNLGICIVQLNWYNKECKKHLRSDIFKEVSKQSIPYYQFRILCHNLIDAECNWTKAEKNFLSEAELMMSLPHFHGIPKIHKNPWALRPIVPCHSWFSTNPAKIVSMYLKPCYKYFPWIIQSTREFVEQISKLKLPHGKKIFLCSGDVSAMYTNIPRPTARNVIRTMLLASDLPTMKVNALLSALDMANEYNYVFYQDRYFLQVKGLAMGTACSPDVANLYAGRMEQLQNIVKKDGNLLLYLRYIDDIFAVVVAANEEEALKYCPHTLGTLSLLWSVSNTRLHFLDVEVFHLPDEDKLRYRPYRKPLNHISRIPWSSFHPKHVKKSVFAGELTRLATCSSHRNDYIDAVISYRNALRLRGWPTEVLHSWSKSETEKRWGNKWDEKPAPSKVFVLPTSYNPVWEQVKTSSVRNAILKFWNSYESNSKEGLATKELSEMRLLVAFSKTLSFGDLVSKWNADLLKQQSLHCLTVDAPEIDYDVVKETDGLTADQFYGVRSGIRFVETYFT